LPINQIGTIAIHGGNIMHAMIDCNVKLQTIIRVEITSMCEITTESTAQTE